MLKNIKIGRIHMIKTKRIVCIALVLVAIVSLMTVFSINAYAAAKTNGENLNNCKWNTKYYIVTDTGKAYGTNTFTIYGGKTVTINSQCPMETNLIKSTKAFVNSIQFKVQVYNGKNLVNTYTKSLGGTFYVPFKLFANEYTVKVTPIIDQNKFSQAGVYYMAEYFKYSLSK